MKSIIILILILFTYGCGLNRTDIKDIHNCVIISQNCGFNNLDGGYYHVKDLTTGKVKRIDVDIRDCSVYKINDTIK